MDAVLGRFPSVFGELRTPSMSVEWMCLKGDVFLSSVNDESDIFAIVLEGLVVIAAVAGIVLKLRIF